MKRGFVILLLVGISGAFLLMNRTEIFTFWNKSPIQIQARAAIMMEADTGRILYAHHADLALPPASMSKMMTELLLLEDISRGKHKWDEQVKTSRYAADVTGSQIGLKKGESLSLQQMFQAIAVHSANDAAVAVAEHLSGSEKTFVERMNRKAKEIGLSGSAYFANATGLSLADLGEYAPKNANLETVMTSRDAALLARALITTYPEVLNVTKLKEVNLTDSRIKLTSTNELLPGLAHTYPGSDGFKTGFTDEAGYCFTGTSVRGGKRLITVVMGADSADSRFTETVKLFDYGFKLTAKAR